MQIKTKETERKVKLFLSDRETKRMEINANQMESIEHWQISCVLRKSMKNYVKVFFLR
jgi:hypothetical protein